MWFSDAKTDNHVWLSIKDMGEPGAYSLDSSEYLTDAAVKEKSVRRVPMGSVLLSFKLTVGRVKIAGCDMTTNEAIACFASDDKRKLAYAYPFLLSFDYEKLGSTSSIATAVNSKTIKAMPVAMSGDVGLDSFYAFQSLYMKHFCQMRRRHVRLPPFAMPFCPSLCPVKLTCRRLTSRNS